MGAVGEAAAVLRAGVKRTWDAKPGIYATFWLVWLVSVYVFYLSVVPMYLILTIRCSIGVHYSLALHLRVQAGHPSRVITSKSD